MSSLGGAARRTYLGGSAGLGAKRSRGGDCAFAARRPLLTKLVVGAGYELSLRWVQHADLSLVGAPALGARVGFAFAADGRSTAASVVWWLWGSLERVSLSHLRFRGRLRLFTAGSSGGPTMGVTQANPVSGCLNEQIKLRPAPEPDH